MTSPHAQLVETLHGIAMYNDKGYQWMGHNAAQIAAQQSLAQAQIERLINEIGESAFSADLLADLRTGRAVRDEMGLVASRVESCLRQEGQSS